MVWAILLVVQTFCEDTVGSQKLCVTTRFSQIQMCSLALEYVKRYGARFQDSIKADKWMCMLIFRGCVIKKTRSSMATRKVVSEHT